jgi:hypothetical protein
VVVHSIAMPINLSSLPAEIRIKIYEELLVLSEPITLEMIRKPSWAFFRDLTASKLHTSRLSSLYPALLLSNKSAHSEASPVLYSRYRFRLQDLPDGTHVTILASFLDQIGRRNASFLRYIYIPFPGLDSCHFGSVTLQDCIHMLIYTFPALSSRERLERR